MYPSSSEFDNVTNVRYEKTSGLPDDPQDRIRIYTQRFEKARVEYEEILALPDDTKTTLYPDPKVYKLMVDHLKDMVCLWNRKRDVLKREQKKANDELAQWRREQMNAWFKRFKERPRAKCGCQGGGLEGVIRIKQQPYCTHRKDNEVDLCYVCPIKQVLFCAYHKDVTVNLCMNCGLYFHDILYDEDLYGYICKLCDREENLYWGGCKKKNTREDAKKKIISLPHNNIHHVHR